MNVRLRYFAGAREATGLDAEELDLADGTSIEALLETLIAQHPKVADIAPSLRFAVGASFAERDHVLHDGDEIALIPPVGGG